MDEPWEELRSRIEPNLEKSRAYLAEKGVAAQDILLAIHAFDTAWPALPDESLDHLVRVSTIAKAFGELGGRIFELQSEYNSSFGDYIRYVGLDTKMNRTFMTDPYGSRPHIGFDALAKELQDALLPNGKVYLFGSRLNDAGRDIPWGCVGAAWESLSKRGVPAFILRDYCFQAGAGMHLWRVDDITALKPDKQYQGCI